MAKKTGEVLVGAGVVNDVGCVRLPPSDGTEKPRHGELPEKGVEGRAESPPSCSTSPGSSLLDAPCSVSNLLSESAPKTKAGVEEPEARDTLGV